uniref:F-box domain-containing protein n=1 Tax=Tanacetum cinerariifolium TaxID=118510 RepID=A0A6L2M4F4_TANCI|nr:hypothetical protein [Tanacetum cinerariifolium]
MSESSDMPNAYFPDEIIREILSRLPVKSLLQFRSVSKHWKSLISDTHFIQSHYKIVETLSTHHRILAPVYPLLSLNYNASPDNISSSIKLDCPFLMPRPFIKFLGSCNGLVCLIDGTKDIIIYNPSTRRYFKPFQSPQCFFHISYASNQTEFVYGFGCGLNPFDIRVVIFPRFARDSELVKFKVYDFIDSVGTFLNGSLHWLARHSNTDNGSRVVASFDVSKEAFRDISLPTQKADRPYFSVGNIKGCLSAHRDGLYHTNVEVWLMREYGVVDSWSMFIKIPTDMGGSEISYMRPLCCVNDDEILIEIELQQYAVYNGKTKTFRLLRSVWNLGPVGDSAVYVESLLSPEVVSCVSY